MCHNIKLRYVQAGSDKEAYMIHEGLHVFGSRVAELVEEVAGGALGAVHLLHDVVPLHPPHALCDIGHHLSHRFSGPLEPKTW